MTELTAKQKHEQITFERFVARLGTRSAWVSIESRPEPEPNLLCVHAVDGPIAFELVSITDPLIAQIQAAGPRASSGASSTVDPSERIIRKKLHKRYETDVPKIELLVYTDGRVITPDDVVIPTLVPWFDTIPHQFQRIWYMGELQTSCLWRSM